MKTKTFMAVAIILGCSLSFWLYGKGRGMRETVGFNVNSVWCGLLFGFILPLGAILLLLLLARKHWKALIQWAPLPVFISLGISLLIGNVLSESWMLYDEKVFSDEVSQLPIGEPYSRPRAWPNSTCSLVFMPGKGIQATD